MRTTLILFSFILFQSAYAATPVGRAELNSPTTKMTGKLEMIPVDEGMKLIAEVKGLKPGAVHGFHIHETGKCEGPDFKSAGEHFNPKKIDHGGPASHAHHTGDLGNLVANKEGVARTDIVLRNLSSDEINSLIGKSVIIHSKADDYATQPSGDSGDRVACGVINKLKI
ncbi:MAG: superoxide dismutase family protein [Bdellovibrionota bacterium]